MKSDQIKAARALLSWTQQDLCAHSGGRIKIATLKQIEADKVRPTEETLKNIKTTFDAHGILTTDRGGVDFKPKGFVELTGDDAFLKLQDDICYTLREVRGEVLWKYIDEGVNEASEKDPVVMKDLMMRREGIRALVFEGDTNLIYPLDEYRALHRQYFINNPQAVYGNKVAIISRDGSGQEIIRIIEDSINAETLRNEFNFMWSKLKRPQKSTRKVRFD